MISFDVDRCAQNILQKRGANFRENADDPVLRCKGWGASSEILEHLVTVSLLLPFNGN